MTEPLIDSKFIINKFKSGWSYDPFGTPVQSPIVVDRASYMTTGPGRYATLDNIPLIRDFFETNVIPPGTYNIDQVRSYFGYSQLTDKPDLKFTQIQRSIDIFSEDYGNRALVWGSTGYILSASTTFVVGSDGARSLVNAEVRAFNDNFDFQSSDTVTSIGNQWLQAAIGGNGVTVPIEFTAGPGRVFETFSESDYAAAQAATAAAKAPPLILELPTLLNAINRELALAKCFGAGTVVLGARGEARPIETISVGDQVVAFAEGGQTHVARVSRVIRAIATNIIELEDGTRVTPEHRYLRPDGSFKCIADILNTDGLIVDAAGCARRISGKHINAFEVGSGANWVFPESEALGSGALSLAPVFGWTVYNLTVEKFHNYIAGNCRVHNECLGPNEQITDVIVNPNGTIKIYAKDEFGSNVEVTEVIDPLTGAPAVVQKDVSFASNSAVVR